MQVITALKIKQNKKTQQNDDRIERSEERKKNIVAALRAMTQRKPLDLQVHFGVDFASSLCFTSFFFFFIVFCVAKPFTTNQMAAAKLKSDSVDFYEVAFAIRLFIRSSILQHNRCSQAYDEKRAILK